jgi:hypothetical protein
LSEGSVRDALERMPVPEQRPAFFDELWEAVAANERAAARRWRRTSLALALVAAAAISSAGVLAATTTSNAIDITASCTADQQGGLPVFVVHAAPSTRPKPGADVHANPPPGYDIVSSVWLETGAQLKLFGFSSLFSGYQLNRLRCSTSKAHVALDRGKLPSAGVFTYPSYVELRKRCVGFGPFLFHVHIANNGEGTPQKAQLAVATKRGKPLVYVDWTPEKVVTYSSNACD